MFKNQDSQFSEMVLVLLFVLLLAWLLDETVLRRDEVVRELAVEVWREIDPPKAHHFSDPEKHRAPRKNSPY